MAAATEISTDVYNFAKYASDAIFFLAMTPC
jgi:hypothetical protein